MQRQLRALPCCCLPVGVHIEGYGFFLDFSISDVNVGNIHQHCIAVINSQDKSLPRMHPANRIDRFTTSRAGARALVLGAGSAAHYTDGYQQSLRVLQVPCCRVVVLSLKFSARYGRAALHL